VAVSGGKDSCLLLTDLVNRQRSFPIRYTLVAAHIQTDFCTCCKKTDLEDFFKSLGVEYVIKDVGVIARLKPGMKMNCYWCSTQRRLELLRLAEELGCNKIALGHHQDDIIETLLMNMCYKGEISGMLPTFKYDNYPGIVIRPLALVNEDLIIEYTKVIGIKSLVCKCPYGVNSSRRDVRKMVRELAKTDRSIRDNLFKSMHNINARYLLDGVECKL
jgi:tRNA(Ile)-lysidine synthase TilS/MesJ